MKYLLDTDHISFLQQRSGTEYTALAARQAQHSAADFAFSIVSFHEQVLGAHTFITQAKTAVDTIRGYTLLLEILHGFMATLLSSPSMPLHLRCLIVYERSEFVLRRWICASAPSRYRRDWCY
jgi:tRNA(fMet)-specific endonuclease VapC